MIENGNDTLQWLLANHLGSTSVTATENGTLNSLLKYSAFGEIWASTGTTLTDYRYTNQLSQAEIGLYYYNARWYDPALGRFVQADTIVPGANNSAAYDRYAYVLNNPVNGTDPSGHDYSRANCSALIDGAYCSPNYNKRTTSDKPMLSNDGNTIINQNISDTVYIFICGDDMQGNCTKKNTFGYVGYGLQQPLTPYRNYAKETGATYYDYATGDCPIGDLNCYKALQQKIVDQIIKDYHNNQSIQFAIVGFSGGAPFATWVAQGVIDSNIPGYQLTVIELDSEINGTHNEQSDIDNLVEIPVTFIAINSLEYKRNNDKGTIKLPIGSITINNIERHTWLANNINVFNLLLPLLNR